MLSITDVNKKSILSMPTPVGVTLDILWAQNSITCVAGASFGQSSDFVGKYKSFIDQVNDMTLGYSRYGLIKEMFKIPYRSGPFSGNKAHVYLWPCNWWCLVMLKLLKNNKNH